MLAIPYMTASGPVKLKFRCLCGDCDAAGHHKYDGPAGQKLRLYNAGVIASTKSDVILVCEGELDAVVADAQMGLPAVATSAGQWLPWWHRCFADFDRVLVVADNDVKNPEKNPGVTHAKKVREVVPRAELVVPPPGMDLTEWIHAEGVDAVAEEMNL